MHPAPIASLPHLPCALAEGVEEGRLVPIHPALDSVPEAGGGSGAAALGPAPSLLLPAAKRQRQDKWGSSLCRQPSAAERVVGAALPPPVLPEAPPLQVDPFGDTPPPPPGRSPIPAPLTPLSAEVAQRAAASAATLQQVALQAAGTGTSAAAAAQYNAAAAHAAQAMALQQQMQWQAAVLSAGAGQQPCEQQQPAPMLLHSTPVEAWQAGGPGAGVSHSAAAMAAGVGFGVPGTPAAATSILTPQVRSRALGVLAGLGTLAPAFLLLQGLPEHAET